MEGATCLIALEHASLHIEKQRTQIETAFQRHNINRSQYAVRAGFDESCIRDGLGFLEQVHIFTTLSTMLATSPLLTELGEILSPFSSILFTESSSLPLPVYKIDGTIWDWDDFVFEPTSKYINRGSTAAMCPTVISYSQTMNDKADQMDSGAGDGDRENVGKEDSEGSQDKGRKKAEIITTILVTLPGKATVIQATQGIQAIETKAQMIWIQKGQPIHLTLDSRLNQKYTPITTSPNPCKY